jgi:iron complex outermembrane receptor protein
LEFTTAAYDIVRKDVFTADPDNPGSARQQIGEQSSKGVELAFAWRPLPTWTVSANAAYVHARNDKFVSGGVNVSGRTPRMVPNKVINAALTWRPAFNWEFGGFAKYVDSVYLNDDNSVKLPGWTRFDVFARAHFDKRTDLTLMVKNLTDKFYADWGIQFLGAQVANIAPPRTWELMFRKKF